MFTPARYCGLPGMRFPARGSHQPTKDEMADYLEAYAARFALPVRTSTRVDGLTRRGDRFVVTAESQTFEANNVVVAMANFQQPKVPPFAADLDASIRQLHSFEYRNPAQLADGAVLVVGVGNSGAEIALEVAKERTTLLAGQGGGPRSLPDRHVCRPQPRRSHRALRRPPRADRADSRRPQGATALPHASDTAHPHQAQGPRRRRCVAGREDRIGRGRSSCHRGRSGARRRQRDLEHRLAPGLLVDRPPRAR